MMCGTKIKTPHTVKMTESKRIILSDVHTYHNSPFCPRTTGIPRINRIVWLNEKPLTISTFKTKHDEYVVLVQWDTKVLLFLTAIRLLLCSFLSFCFAAASAAAAS
jgi:hypothetical protein